jgi:hypothetical protein
MYEKPCKELVSGRHLNLDLRAGSRNDNYFAATFDQRNLFVRMFSNMKNFQN